jgi:hypothetical protein
MAYKLIALDLDGTLLDEEKRVSRANRAALSRARAEGMRIMVNSGRILPEAERCVAGVDSVSLVSACNGAMIRDTVTGEVVFKQSIDRESCVRAIRELKSAKPFFSVYGENTVFFLRDTLGRFPMLASFVEGMACPLVVTDDLVAELEAHRAQPYKIFVMSSYANNIELAVAGFSVAMGNASPEVRGQGRYLLERR